MTDLLEWHLISHCWFWIQNTLQRCPADTETIDSNQAYYKQKNFESLWIKKPMYFIENLNLNNTYKSSPAKGIREKIPFHND